MEQQPFILCIVGASRSGKTTLIESLLPRLRERGLRVGTVKHSHHPLDVDREGKDSWRHAKAGAEQVVLMGPHGHFYADYRERELSAEEVIARHFDGVDLALIEGYKWGKLPKIEVFRRAVRETPQCAEDEHLCAIVTDDPISVPAPTFGTQDAEEVADFIANLVETSRLLKTLSTRLAPSGRTQGSHRFEPRF